jgi:hypothetical protein
MKTALYGRALFGASAVFFGVIALMWRDAETWQSMHRILTLPFGTVIGVALMIAQIAGGVALPLPRTARVGSIVLGVVYGLFALACIPGILAAPKAFGEYDGFFEQFSLLSGALAVYAVTGMNAAGATVLARLARLGFGVSTVSFTLAQWIYLHETASLVPAWIPPNPMFWTILTTIAFGLAAIAILTNIRARLALRLMTLMVVIFGVVVWVPRMIAHPSAHLLWSECALTFLIAGAAWVVSDL